jgi:hypothetical protein
MSVAVVMLAMMVAPWFIFAIACIVAIVLKAEE